MNLFTASIRKHKGKLAVCAALLCLEAVFCLFTPAILGNIINTGIQSKGIRGAYPQVMSRNAFALFLRILPEDKGTELSGLYGASGSARDDLRIRSEKECCYIKKDADEEKAAELYGNAVWAAVLTAREYEGFDAYDYDSLVEKVSMNTLYIAASRLELPPEKTAANYTAAEKAPNAVKRQAASLLLPYICEDAGVDCLKTQRDYIIPRTVLMVISVLLQFGCASAGAYCISDLSAAAEREMRAALIRKTFRFSAAEFSQAPPSYIASIVTDGVKQIGMSINYGLRPVISSVFLAAAGSALILRRSILFGILVIVSAALILLNIVAIYRVTYRRYYRMQEKYGEYSAAVRYNLSQLFAVRSNNAQTSERKRADRSSDAVRKDESFVMKAVLSAFSVTALLINAMTAAAVILGGKSMLDSTLDIGSVVTYIQYSVIIVTSFMTLGAAVIFAPKALKALRDIDAIGNIPVSADIYEQNTKDAPEVIDSVVFDRVRLFENSPEISFTAKKGEITLITGKTGTGKTLLMEALIRDFIPSGGKITVGGENIAGLSARYPSDCVSMTGSRPVLFSGTVRENLLLSGARNDEGSMLSALQNAQCDFLENGSGALEQVLKNGGELLSGGQRSRLTLAGAFAKSAKIRVFDDCFSSLDEDTKIKILTYIRESSRDAVVIIISHTDTERKFADRVVSLEDA